MSTFCSLHYHLVFSTKYRKPWIKDDWIDRLHQYMGGTLKKLDVQPLCIGGVTDHVHLLLGTRTTHRISDIVRELKKSSTQWVHDTISFEPFRWQNGYAVISLSPDALASVTKYINNQAEHHRIKSFNEELREILDSAGIEYDPQYLE